MKWQVTFNDSEYDTCIVITATNVIEVDFHTINADGVIIELGEHCHIKGIETGTTV